MLDDINNLCNSCEEELKEENRKLINLKTKETQPRMALVIKLDKTLQGRGGLLSLFLSLS